MGYVHDGINRSVSAAKPSVQLSKREPANATLGGIWSHIS